MKFLLPMLVLLYQATSCNSKSKEEKKVKQQALPFDQRETEWENKLVEWNVIRYNDSAKWRVYCYYGDNICTKGTNNRQLVPIPLGFLALKLRYAQYENDTLSLLYNFMYDDSTIVRYTDKEYKETFGVEFDVKADTVIGYEHGHGTFLERGLLVRYENFTHPDLIQFVSQNANRLHPWFRKEIERRRLLLR